MTFRFKCLIIFCIALLGCGTGGGNNGGSNPTSNPTMQAGQWEFVLTPPGGYPVYLEANLTFSFGNFNSTVPNTADFVYGNSPVVAAGPVGPSFQIDSNLEANGSLTNGLLAGSFATPGGLDIITLSNANMASTGQSVSGGSYTIASTFTIFYYPANSSGTLTGYVVSPLNGTYSGTLTGGSAGADKFTIQVTQDSNFGITASGTSSVPGVVTNLSISPSGSPTDNLNGYSNVIGATVSARGTASSLNGNSTFSVSGHFNASGSQLQIELFGNSGTETGTLTKQ